LVCRALYFYSPIKAARDFFLISVFQTYVNEETRSLLDSSFYPCSLDPKNELREHSALLEIFRMSHALKKGIKYFGVTDSAFSGLTDITGEEIISYIKRDIYSGDDRDVYLYCPVENLSIQPIYGSEEKFAASVPDLKNNTASRWLSSHAIFPQRLLTGWQYSTHNYWIAKPEVLDDYCRNWLAPAVEYIKKKEIINAYPILESLFGYFLANSNYSFRYLVKKRIKGMKRLHWIKIEQDRNKNQLKIAS